MAKYTGGQPVKKGYYLKHNTGEYIAIREAGSDLPGSEEMKYSRLPLAVLIALGPLLGLFYFILSPTIFCLTSLYALTLVIGRKVRTASEKVALGSP